jgi:hypothetical protein
MKIPAHAVRTKVFLAELVFAASIVLAACEARTQLKSAVDGSAITDGVDGATDVVNGCGKVRVPQRHRAAGSTCPGQRGPGLSGLESQCSPDGGPPINCWQDSDCTAGTNGRCLGTGRMTCMSTCSYDQCASDSDCPNNEPCECRTSESSYAANACATGGNCRVDSDCGPCGYCSPSQVDQFCFCPSSALCPDGGGGCYVATSSGWQEVPCACGDACGHGHFCHTPRDTCTDDSDCNGGTCNYDRLNKVWSCSICWPVP